LTDRNDRIRELAYFLWLEEGCPEGAAERHWLAAQTLFDSDPLGARWRHSRSFGAATFGKEFVTVSPTIS
jgi:hypothetical protein